ncbi:DUF6686 family protein [Paradesertivirga mongoliensis]|uniref:DUF6686 family protein n=1 Tax=Paradesertivirga mongoliensis TaxID=2100740 RepID=A0ABW4ZQ32_9SPHI|nr:DUF6686 family protein [Pedobacter mongoliensis]
MKDNNCIKIVEVFRTENGSVSQCNKTNSYILEFGGTTCSFKASDFIDFTKRVNSLDLVGMILSSSSVTDVTVLMPPYSERCFVLTLTDVLNLKELLGGAKFSLHLNSVIWECLRPHLYSI